MVTTDEIREKLTTNQEWLERGIVAIYERQTPTEQTSKTTLDQNGVGFNGADGSYGTYLARYILRQSHIKGFGRNLSGEHVGNARKMMLKYSGQLFRIATANNSN